MQENPLKIFFPGKLVFGNGTLTQLADDVLQWNPSKVFIVTIRQLIANANGNTL
jgi:alcohol dehydrogenase class IV